MAEDSEMVWTKFTDMHSGGGCKLGFEEIWVEAPECSAVDLFEKIFKRDPNNVTCNCCGEDFWYGEEEFGSIKRFSAVITQADITGLLAGKKLVIQTYQAG